MSRVHYQQHDNACYQSDCVPSELTVFDPVLFDKCMRIIKRLRGILETDKVLAPITLSLRIIPLK